MSRTINIHDLVRQHNTEETAVHMGVDGIRINFDRFYVYQNTDGELFVNVISTGKTFKLTPLGASLNVSSSMTEDLMLVAFNSNCLTIE